MQLTITLPNREETLALNRQRWKEVLADRELMGLQQRIETNAYGNVLMSPPASGEHSGRQGNMIRELILRGQWRANPECPISTIDGVRAADVGAYSPARYETVRGQIAFERAPEICIEILSPRNTIAEIKYKFRLYFEAGATECWKCDLQGKMSYYLDQDTEIAHEQSKLCPDFPPTISD